MMGNRERAGWLALFIVLFGVGILALIVGPDNWMAAIHWIRRL